MYEIIATKRFLQFVEQYLSYHEKDRLINDLSLIAKKQSLEYCEVRNDLFNDVCKKYGLGSPKRYKALYCARNRGGIRVIFAFTKDDDLQIIKVDFRDNNPYGDGN